MRAASHLYVHDVASGQSTQLTSGAHDETSACRGRRTGSQIAYVTRRGEEPDRHSQVSLYLVEPRAGATERPLAQLDGADNDLDLEARARSGRRTAAASRSCRAARKSGSTTPRCSSPSSTQRPARVTVPAPIDRWFTQPRWSPDGKSVLALIEQSRVINLSRVDVASGKVTPLTTGPRYDAGFAVSKQGRIVVLGGDDVTPYELAALEKGALRPLGTHNEWLAQKQLVRFDDITFKSADGTSIDGFVVKPPDYVPGRRYPTILRIHGGPVYQFSHEFMPDWQAYAAQGVRRRRSQSARQFGTWLRVRARPSSPTGATRTCRTCWPRSITSSRRASRIRIGSASAAAATAASSPTT